MPLKYRLVKRKDMSKGAAEGTELYFAQTSITKKVDLNRICARISKYSTASRGDILLVLDGFITVMNESLADGESIHLGDFGSFRLVAGSKGAATEEEFKTSLFNRAHIVFYPSYFQSFVFHIYPPKPPILHNIIYIFLYVNYILHFI